jgi:hypothetical protein
MSDINPTAILFDVNANPIGVSGGMVLPTGTLGQLLAGVDTSNFVRYLTSLSGALLVTGSVNINSFPVTQGVSGSQLTGSTFSGQPIVMGGVFLTGSSIGVSASIVKALQTDISGALYVTSTGSLPMTLMSLDWSLIDSILTADKDTFGAAIAEGRTSQFSANFVQTFINNSVVTSSTGGATITQLNGVAALTSSTGATTSAKINSIGTIRYIPAREVYAMFTAHFTVPTSVNSNQRIGLYDANNGFFIGYNGTTFGTTVRNTGTDTFTAITSWNGDLLNGLAGSKFTRNRIPEAIDFTKDNVFRIRFGWLGSAPIKYQVISPDGVWVTFHTIKQPNLSTAPSIANPNLPITFEVIKTGADATNLIMSTNCWDAGCISANQQVQNSNIDAGNSSTTILGGNALFSGSVIDLSGYAATTISCFSDKAGSLQVQFSPDGTNWDQNTVFAVAAATPASVQMGPQAQFFRLVYVNGAAAQTVFRLQTIHRTIGAYSPTVPVSSVLDGSGDALVVKAVVTGKTTAGGGSYVEMKVSPSGAVQVGGAVDQGVAAALSGAWPFVITDNTQHGPANVIVPYLQAEGSSASLQVALSPASPLPSGTNLIGSVNVTSTGSQGIGIGNAPYDPIFVSVTSSLPVTIVGSTSVWQVGPIAVTGSQLTGSTYIGFPVVMGGVYLTGSLPNISSSIVKAIQLDVSGAQVHVGNKTSNVSLPGSNNIGILPAIVSNATPSLTDGTQSALSIDLAGNLRVAAGGNGLTTTIADWSVVNNTVAWTSATTINTTFNAGPALLASTIVYTLSVAGGAITAGTLTFEATDNSGASWYPIRAVRIGTVTADLTYSLIGATLQAWQINASALGDVRVRLSTAIAGAGTATLNVQVGTAPAANSAFVSGSVMVETTGSQGICVGNAPYDPLYISITSSLPVTFAGLPQLQISNFPAVQAVSGSQLTGSTYIGFPVVMGGVFLTGTLIGVSASIVKALQTDISGALYVTTTGSLPVTVIGPVQVWSAATLGVSGTVKTYDTGIQAVSGSQLTGSTFSGQPIVMGGVFLTGTLIGVSASIVKAIRTDISGAVFVVVPSTVMVSGSQLTGSTYVGFPVVMGGVFLTGTVAPSSASVVTAIQTDASGVLYNRDIKDVGRLLKNYATSSVSGTLGETLISFQALSDFALSGSTASTFGARFGRVLRLQSMILTWNSATAVSGSVICRFRVSPAGAVTATSPSVFALAVANSNAASSTGANATGINQGATAQIMFPDGFEISGIKQFGVTQQANTTAAGFDVAIMGYEYIPSVGT